MNQEVEQSLNTRVNFVSDIYLSIADRIKVAILASKATSTASQYLTPEESIVVFGGAKTILEYALKDFDLDSIKEKESETLEVPNG